jgi:hypothetical protein
VRSRFFRQLRTGGISPSKPVGGFVVGVPTKDVRTSQTENSTVAIDGVFLKLVSSEELDEVRHRLQIPLGTDLKYQQSRYQANSETMKGKATFEWRNGNKYWIELGLYSRSIGLFK